MTRASWPHLRRQSFEDQLVLTYSQCDAQHQTSGDTSGMLVNLCLYGWIDSEPGACAEHRHVAAISKTTGPRCRRRVDLAQQMLCLGRLIRLGTHAGELASIKEGRGSSRQQGCVARHHGKALCRACCLLSGPSSRCHGLAVRTFCLAPRCSASLCGRVCLLLGPSSRCHGPNTRTMLQKCWAEATS